MTQTPLSGLTSDSAYGKYEPEDIGNLIDNNWRRCWPRVISRAWMYQLNNKEKAKLIEHRLKFEAQNGDDAWFQDLLSHSPEATKRALMAEGMVYGASENGSPESWEEWVFTRIIVKTRSQNVSMSISDSIAIEESSSNCQQHLDEISNKYQFNDNGTLSDSVQQKLHQMLGFELETQTQGNSPLFTKMLLDSIAKKLLFNFEKSSQNSNTYIRTNPWYITKSTGHFLALTLPPKPQNPSQYAEALSDYMATNKIYPFV